MIALLAKPPLPERAPQTIYDGRYFDAELHRRHWFTNNDRKRELRRREVLRMLELTPSDRVLEIGCATGEHTIMLARGCREVVGLDLAPTAIERARSRAEREGVANAIFTIGNAADLSRWSAGSFDKVAAIDFVEHVDDKTLGAVFGEVRRVLDPGGRLAIFTPCATHYVERMKARNIVLRQLPGHIAVRGPDAYSPLLAAAGLVPTAMWFSPSTYPVVGWLDRALGRVPGLGPWFRFRICIVAIKPSER